MRTRRTMCPAALVLALGGGAACGGEEGTPERVAALAQALAPGFYQLQADDESCVEVSGASLDNGADIVTATCTDRPEQRWRFILRPDGTFRIKNVNSSKCMRAARETNVQQGRCIYQRSKWWVHEETSGLLQLESRRTQRCAAAAGTVEQATCDSAEPSQLWLLTQPCTLCGEECVDLATNASHCGACGHVCSSGACIDGECLGCIEG
jgi:hypothetical protein